MDKVGLLPNLKHLDSSAYLPAIKEAVDNICLV